MQKIIKNETKSLTSIIKKFIHQTFYIDFLVFCVYQIYNLKSLLQRK